MSKTCGDTARFNRIRKHKIALRLRSRELQAAIALKHAKIAPVVEDKAKPVL